MKVLWTHNFDPAKPNSLVFTDIAAQGIREKGIDLQLEYLGNLRSLPNLLHTRSRLERLSRDFELVHAHYGSACALTTAAIKGVPKVLSIRGNDWNVHSDSFGFYYWHTRLARYMTKRSIRNYDCILPVSQRITSELKSCFPRSHIETMPSPIDLTKFVPRDKAEAKSLLGYPNENERWVLFTSLNLRDPIKRFSLARDAFQIANAKCGNLRLKIANDLPHEMLPLLVAACDLILCTSESEGWPNSVKEAIACNVPFISTDVSDLPYIARYENTCRICPPDKYIIADSICDALTASERPDLRKYVSGMSLDILSDRLLSIYESLISQHRGTR